MYPDPSLLDHVSTVFDSIIAKEKQSSKGDHFAAGGSNDRIWNSFSKHGLSDPQSFTQYYDNKWLARICSTWLGPAYRITAQVNVVNPGGIAQVCHRDYHLGFQTAEECAKFPAAMQVASQLLTLQGAVAHTDMPLASGPTRFLPFSQMCEEGFMAYRLPEFVEYFNDHYVSLLLEKGDGVFFNPALFHAAGANETEDFRRIANLLQISSAFGKTMESVDSVTLVEKCWEDLRKKAQVDGIGKEVLNVVRAVGEGYPFPTNLDNRPPAPGGMAPESEQDVIVRGLREAWDSEKICRELRMMKDHSRA
jgi:ectoine hydroxylase-related dioxygenase (phytanoyl-CoA dioxygenase family)